MQAGRVAVPRRGADTLAVVCGECLTRDRKAHGNVATGVKEWHEQGWSR